MSAEHSADQQATAARDMEIERKFIVFDPDPELLRYAGSLITQGYIRARGDTETRVRDEDGNHTFTAKTGSGLSRLQQEIDISRAAYENILPLTQGREVEKQRRKIPCRGHTIELDTYGGKAEGLAVAEIEFPSETAARHFLPPGWFGREVTDDRRYKNREIALHGHPDRRSAEGAPVPEVPLDQAVVALNTYTEALQTALERPVVVAVAGGSASGKTSAVAARIAEYFGDDAMMVSLDDYYKGVSYMQQFEQATGRKLSFDDPEAVDMELAAEHLEALRAGETVQKPHYDFATGEHTEYIPTRLEGKKIIIVEGLFALSEDLAPVADVTCFVKTETHGRLMRRLMRDTKRTSWPRREIIAYFKTLENEYRTHVEPTAAHADIIVNNDYQAAAEARNSEVFETQVKYPAGSIDGDFISKLGGELIAPGAKQVDLFYNPPGIDLADTDEMVRLRYTGDSVTFGYKGPRLPDDGVRRRPKIDESPIDNETAEGLKEFYLQPDPAKTVTKERSAYILDDVLVMIDENVTVKENDGRQKTLGRYVELRGSTKEKIERARQRLGLDPALADTRAYFDM